MLNRRHFGLLALAPWFGGAALAAEPAPALVSAADIVRQHPQNAGQVLRLRLADPGSLSVHPLAAACLRVATQDDLHLLFTDVQIPRWTQGGFDKARGGSVQFVVRVRENKFGRNVLADVLEFATASSAG